MSDSWRPTATLKALRKRAEILANIRNFFKQRQVLEVQTPLLSAGTVTDPHLESFETLYKSPSQQPKKLYLQTSPEFAMKRLLASGSGPIYQITHAFRNQGEQGRWHNPEFSLLEWYRPGFTLKELMDETQDLLQLILDCPVAQRLTYAEIFKNFLNFNPFDATLIQIKKVLDTLEIKLEPTDWLTDRDTGLQLIVEYLVQYNIDQTRPLFLYDFPQSQAALARIRCDIHPVAERVEVYYQGLELANGFHELADPKEQKERFVRDLKKRWDQNLPAVPFDTNLIAALAHGLPDCSGIALGLDRFVALATKSEALSEVISFPITRA